jgi:hypothetical protein
MLKSVEGIYDQGEIKLQEKPDNIPQKTKVIVTFLNSEQSELSISSSQILTNEEIEQVLETYRQENKTRPFGLCKGEFIVPDNFNEPLPDEILELFEG